MCTCLLIKSFQEVMKLLLFIFMLCKIFAARRRRSSPVRCKCCGADERCFLFLLSIKLPFVRHTRCKIDFIVFLQMLSGRRGGGSQIGIWWDEAGQKNDVRGEQGVGAGGCSEKGEEKGCS